MENPRFPTLHHSLRAAFLLLPVALRAKHSQKGIAKDFLANGRRKTKPIYLEEKRSFSTLKNHKHTFCFSFLPKDHRHGAFSKERGTHPSQKNREPKAVPRGFFGEFFVLRSDNRTSVRWVSENGKRKANSNRTGGKRSFPTSMPLYQKALASVFDFLYLLFVSTKILRHG